MPTNQTSPNDQGTCLLTQKQLISEYFMEYRNRVLAVAAFLDRMDRSIEHNAEDDFRVVALRKAMHVLIEDGPERVERIQMIFSDPNITLMDERDRQNAYGAYSEANASANGHAGHDHHHSGNGHAAVNGNNQDGDK
jgi:hypothetical protein